MSRRHRSTEQRVPTAEQVMAAKAKYAAKSLGITTVKASRDELVAKIPAMTREQFELRLVNIETSYQLAYEAAKALDYLRCDARDLARQRRMNMMVESMICMLEDEANVTVDVNRQERTGKVPFPPQVDHLHSMLNFDNRR